jgi:hypothetical protein
MYSYLFVILNWIFLHKSLKMFFFLKFFKTRFFNFIILAKNNKIFWLKRIGVEEKNLDILVVKDG